MVDGDREVYNTDLFSMLVSEYMIIMLQNIPQALQMVWPSSSLLHNGVTVVPQF
jgi:hypothetical protein